MDQTIPIRKRFSEVDEQWPTANPTRFCVLIKRLWEVLGRNVINIRKPIGYRWTQLEVEPRNCGQIILAGGMTSVVQRPQNDRSKEQEAQEKGKFT